MSALEVLRGWGAPAAAGYLVGPPRAADAIVEGEVERLMPWASVSKVVTALAVWVAVEEGVTGWDHPGGPPGATLRHLLSHASGLAPDDDRVLAAPARSRIYSNRGIEVAAQMVADGAGLPFEQYAAEAVLEPLGMTGTRLGHPSHGAHGPLSDLLRLAGELLDPTLVDRATWARATAVAFPGLSGVLPGFGRQPDNAWGLGVEIRDHKVPHWTGRRNSPATFGHFGRSGSFLWVDPVAEVAAASLCDRPFGAWAAEAWPAISDAVLAAARPRPSVTAPRSEAP
ncbi:MAG: serine hydrolase [Actinomycetota bacterium]|nr:serine hydrolase [Actinomycetota bacterium]